MTLPKVKTLLREAAVSIRLISRPQLVGVRVSNHPPLDQMEDGKVYIVGDRGNPKWAVFRCPNHERDIIHLPLMQSRRPRWTITLDFLDRPTIYPSVRQLDGALAHFWVRAGNAEWCSDSGWPHPDPMG